VFDRGISLFSDGGNHDVRTASESRVSNEKRESSVPRD
jgi:hypothetical protein